MDENGKPLDDRPNAAAVEYHAEGSDFVDVHITRWDLVRFYAVVTPRQVSTWVVWGIFAISTAGGVYSSTGVPSTVSKLVATLVVVIALPTLMLALGLVLSIGAIIAWSASSPGILGRHKYTFKSDGLREETSANTTLIKWGGAKEVRWFGHLLTIKVSPFLVHIVPRRCFGTPGECEAFWQSAQRLVATDQHSG